MRDKSQLKYKHIIEKMTLAEKALMMSGKSVWETRDFEKHKIPSVMDLMGLENRQELATIWA